MFKSRGTWRNSTTLNVIREGCKNWCVYGKRGPENETTLSAMQTQEKGIFPWLSEFTTESTYNF